MFVHPSLYTVGSVLGKAYTALVVFEQHMKMSRLLSPPSAQTEGGGTSLATESHHRCRLQRPQQAHKPFQMNGGRRWSDYAVGLPAPVRPRNLPLPPPPTHTYTFTLYASPTHHPPPFHLWKRPSETFLPALP